LPDEKQNPAVDPSLEKKASLGQVTATLFWAMCMIGKKGTWERDGVKISLMQAVIGALIAGCVVVGMLILLVRLAIRLSA
jgi:Protein of unknown function (DUF2970)